MHLFIRLNYIKLLIFNHFWPTKNDNTLFILYLILKICLKVLAGTHWGRDSLLTHQVFLRNPHTSDSPAILWGLAARDGQGSGRKVNQSRSLAGWKSENSTCVFPVSLLLLQWRKRLHVPGSPAAEGKMLAWVTEWLRARALDRPSC